MDNWDAAVVHIINYMKNSDDMCEKTDGYLYAEYCGGKKGRLGFYDEKKCIKFISMVQKIIREKHDQECGCDGIDGGATKDMETVKDDGKK